MTAEERNETFYSKHGFTILNYIPVFILFLTLLTSFLLGFTPLLVSTIYFVLGLATFFLYARDKRAAQRGDWRVSEGTLHTFSLLCGWPGAIIAQQKLRHKTKKKSFRTVFWITVLANSGGLGWVHTDQGATEFHLFTSKVEEVILNEVTNTTIRNKLLYLLKFHSYV